MRYKIIIFALVLFALLAVGLEWAYRYHFFFIEQNQLFLFTGDYFSDALSGPGGTARWAGEFFVQFFALPLAGPIVTALLLTAAGVMAALVGRRMAPGVPLWLLWTLPALGLLCVHFDFNWFYQGTVAFLVAMGALLLYVGRRRYVARLVCGAVSVPLLFWLCGPVALLYAVSVAVWEAAAGNRRWYLSLALPVEAAAIAWAAVQLAFVGDWNAAFTPGAYYTVSLDPGVAVWLAWASVPVVIIGSRLCRALRVNSLKREVILAVVQVAAVVVVAWAGVAKFIDRNSYHLKRLDHYSRTGQWDAIEEASRGRITNFMYLNLLNLALAEKGALADEMFRYDQRGVEGLVLPWNQQFMPAVIRSDIFFCTGNAAIAQEMAFEANLSTNSYGSPRMMQRLVQTNLIYGAWPVAEKYLDLLSRTLLYRDWAAGQRRFLYDDAAVDADPVLGEKRRCLPAVSRLSQTPPEDLEVVARQNPQGKTAVEYLGAMILLSKNVELFRSFVEEYYGGANAGELPRSFQEAVVAIWETDPAMWERYRVDEGVGERFEGFRKRFVENRSQQGIANLMRGEYGDTFWFYLMFK